MAEKNDFLIPRQNRHRRILGFILGITLGLLISSIIDLDLGVGYMGEMLLVYLLVIIVLGIAGSYAAKVIKLPDLPPIWLATIAIVLWVSVTFFLDLLIGYMLENQIRGLPPLSNQESLSYHSRTTAYEGDSAEATGDFLFRKTQSEEQIISDYKQALEASGWKLVDYKSFFPFDIKADKGIYRLSADYYGCHYECENNIKLLRVVIGLKILKPDLK